MNCWSDRAILDLARSQIDAKTYEVGRAMDEVGERLSILDDLERGDTTVEETIRRLQGAGDRSQESLHRKYARQWWIKPLVLGGILSVAGVLFGIQGGWLWLLAAPLLFVGLVITTLGVAAIDAQYVHLRIQLHKRRQIAFSFPVPLRLGAGLLKRFGSNIPQFDETTVDELIMSLQNLDQPLTIEVDRGTGGERVHLHFG